MAGPEPLIRAERPEDADSIASLVEQAFGGPGEARLVALLRSAGALAGSLVAEADGRLAGHVALSPMSIAGAAGPWLGLAPLAVQRAARRHGIGVALVRSAIARAADLAMAAVFVLGEPGYYAQLGFVEAAPLGWRCSYPAPPPAFRVHLLDLARLPPPGTMRYHQAFDAL